MLAGEFAPLQPFLDAIGVKTGLATGIIGGILMIVIGAVIAHRNVRLGAAIIGILLCFEAGFVAVLALIIVIKGGTLGHFSSAPFDPSAAKAGFTGLSLAAIFAFLSIAGVDSVAPVAAVWRAASTPSSPSR